jgi:hypothetical protein
MAREQRDCLAVQYYLYAEVTKSALPDKPPVRIRVVQWDGGTMSMATTNHLVSISTARSRIDIEIPTEILASGKLRLRSRTRR